MMYDYKYGNYSNLCKEAQKIKKAKKENEWHKTEFFSRKEKNEKRGSFIKILSNRFFRHIVNP